MSWLKVVQVAYSAGAAIDVAEMKLKNAAREFRALGYVEAAEALEHAMGEMLRARVACTKAMKP